MPEKSTKVSLVLGSGGARGLAHIGVIQWLTCNGYSIRSISGASIGALVGGVYAADKLDVYTQWVRALERMHVLRLLDPAIGRPGLFKGDRIMSVLRELIGDCVIEDLPVAFTAVATDMSSREEVWLTISQLCLSAYTPDVTIGIPRNACGFFEFWRAEEMIDLGRERAAQAFARLER